jgi:hypothetical protein
MPAGESAFYEAELGEPVKFGRKYIIPKVRLMHLLCYSLTMERLWWLFPGSTLQNAFCASPIGHLRVPILTVAIITAV